MQITIQFLLNNKEILNIAGLSLAVIASVMLFHGSRGIPFEMQSWKGTSEKEVSFKKKRRFLAGLGFLLLVLGLFIQIVVVFLKG